MTKEEIKKKVLEFGDWVLFFERPFGAYMMSLFMGSSSRTAMKMIGLDVEHPAAVFEEGAWYMSKGAYEAAAVDLRREIANGLSMKKISEECARFRQENRKRIIELRDSSISPRVKLKEVLGILKIATSYIWITHDFEYVLTPRFRQEVEKRFADGDTDKIIGDLSFPTKKNSHNYLDDELRAGVDAATLAKRYGWMKARDGFADPYSQEEMEELRKGAKPETEVQDVDVPAELKDFVEEMRELVFFRTFRTDVFYELIFLARPILEAVGREYGIPFQELKNYSVYDLASGNPKRYPPTVSCAYYKDEAAFFLEPILKIADTVGDTIKGTVAFRGVARGIVRVVKNVESLSKVHEGDILVAPMTSPNFLVAMKKAAAFVTDEGGITCHAAIVAREMRKPCIIGTKNATKVLKDGDMVEVDAEKGIVRIIK